jgi:hypothetical protein
VLQVANAQTGTATFAAFTKAPLPTAMNEVASFGGGSVVGFEDPAYVANAPSFDTLGVDVRVERNEVVGEQRLVTLQIDAPDSNIVTGRVKGVDLDNESQVTVISMTLNGVTNTKDDIRRFSCHGRGCRSLAVTLALNANELEVSFQVNGFRYGLDASGQAMLSARPASALPRSWGDLRLVSETVELQ